MLNMVKNKTVQKKVEGGKYGYILTTVVGRIGARGNVVKAKKTCYCAAPVCWINVV